jgi:hypothetical protein
MVGALQSVASFAAAQADYNAKAEQWKQNYLNALASARDDQNQLTIRQVQEEQATSQKLHTSLVEEAKNKAEVVAGADYVSGLSIDALVQDQGMAAGTNRAGIEQNLKMKVAQLQKEKDATNTTALNRINSVARPVSPSGFSLAVGVLGAGVKAFGTA